MAVKQIKKSDIINMIMEGVALGSKRDSVFETNDPLREAVAFEVYNKYMFSIEGNAPAINSYPQWLTEVEDFVRHGSPLHAVKRFKESQQIKAPSLKEAKDAIWKYRETGNWKHWRFR